MQPQQIRLEKACAVIHADNVMLNDSRFNNVSMCNISITDANLSDLRIEGAQLGGASFKNIGMYPPGHPMYDPALEQRPLQFENCDLHGSMIENCNLSGIEINDCNISGMKINGILVEELLKNRPA
jgi:uncharacterized protein YjbI with pentapeptide repeats